MTVDQKAIADARHLIQQLPRTTDRRKRDPMWQHLCYDFCENQLPVLLSVMDGQLATFQKLYEDHKELQRIRRSTTSTG